MGSCDNKKLGRGRPKKHSNKQLMELLLLHASKYPDRINSNALAQETGISRSTWERRMGQQITELSTRPITVCSEKDSYPIVNPADFVDLYKNNLEKLKEELTSFHYTIMNLLNKARSYDVVVKENEELRIENNAIKNELAQLQQVATTLSKNIYFTEVVKGNFTTWVQRQLDISRQAKTSIFDILEQHGVGNVVNQLKKNK